MVTTSDIITAFFDNFDKLIIIIILIFEIKLLHTIVYRLLEKEDYLPAIATILCMLGVFIILISGYTKEESVSASYTAAYAAFLNMSYLLILVGLYKKYFPISY